MKHGSIELSYVIFYREVRGTAKIMNEQSLLLKIASTLHGIPRRELLEKYIRPFKTCIENITLTY